jgi:hypothetical protein
MVVKVARRGKSEIIAEERALLDKRGRQSAVG